jgi:hypothetical protein
MRGYVILFQIPHTWNLFFQQAPSLLKSSYQFCPHALILPTCTDSDYTTDSVAPILST